MFGIGAPEIALVFVVVALLALFRGTLAWRVRAFLADRNARRTNDETMEAITGGTDSFRRRGYRFLRRRRVSEKKAERVFLQASDEELLWAYYHPDHSSAARSILVGLLESRGIALNQVDQWTPPLRSLAVVRPPGFDSIHEMTQRGRRSRLAYRAARVAIFASLVASLALMRVVKSQNHQFVQAAVEAGFIDKDAYDGDVANSSREEVDEALVKDFADEPVLLSEWGLARPVLTEDFANAPFAIVGVTCLVLALLVPRTRCRILVLRSFGRRDITRRMKRLVEGNLRGIAQTFTLEDRYWAPSRAFRSVAFMLSFLHQGFVLLLALIMRPSPRFVGIRKERQFIKFRKYLAGNGRLKLWWNVTGGRTFNIKATDPWWKSTALVLMASCNVIMVDLSEVKAGTIWELERIAQLGLVSRTLFVAWCGSVLGAEQTLANWAASNDLKPLDLYVYDDGGRFDDEVAFRCAVFHASAQV